MRLQNWGYRVYLYLPDEGKVDIVMVSVRPCIRPCVLVSVSHTFALQLLMFGIKLNLVNPYHHDADSLQELQ